MKAVNARMATASPITVGQRIRHLREQRHLTQAQLAHGLFDRSYISQIESGTAIPPLQTLELLCVRLNVPVSSVLMDPARRNQSLQHRARINLRQGIQSQSIDQVRLAWELLVDQPVTPDFVEATLYLSQHESQNDRLLYMLQRAALKILGEGSDLEDSIDVLIALGNNYFHARQFLNALSVYQAIVEDGKPSIQTQARVYFNMGSSYYALDRSAEAIPTYELALDLAGGEWPNLLAACHHGLGVAYRSLGDLTQAYHHTALAINLYTGSDTLKHFQAVHNLGVILREQGALEMSEHHLLRAWQHYEAAGRCELVASVCEELAKTSLQAGRLVDAATWCRKGLDAVYQTNEGGAFARLLELQLHILAEAGQTVQNEDLKPVVDYLVRIHCCGGISVNVSPHSPPPTEP